MLSCGAYLALALLYGVATFRTVPEEAALLQKVRNLHAARNSLCKRGYLRAGGAASSRAGVGRVAPAPTSCRACASWVGAPARGQRPAPPRWLPARRTSRAPRQTSPAAASSEPARQLGSSATAGHGSRLPCQQPAAGRTVGRPDSLCSSSGRHQHQDPSRPQPP